MRQISIFDTTLRDGEQAPGASLTLERKLSMARTLADLGVDVIEPGFPISSEGEFEAVRTIARTVQGPTIIGFARLKKEDIDRAIEAIRDAAKPRLHLFISSSSIHLEHQLRKSPKEVLAIVQDLVSYAKQFVHEVEFSAMDASRTKEEYLFEMIETALDAGATVINLPDTVGYAMPREYGAMFANVRRNVRGIDRAQLSAHCHNDLGLAVANSLAAIENGASIIECTLGGIGERAGNTALEEIVMAIHTRGNELQASTGVRTERLYDACRMASRQMRFPIAPNKAITGRNAFAHEAGIHQDGLLKNRQTYEIMDPVQIGVPRQMIVLGKHSGHHAMRERVKELGVDIRDRAKMDRLYVRFKQLADEKRWMTDDDLLGLLGEDVAAVPDGFELLSIQQSNGTSVIPTVTASVCHRRTGEERTGAVTGSSVIEAVLVCLSRLCEAPTFQVEARTTHTWSADTGSGVEATVLVAAEKFRFTGTEYGTDPVTAVAKAYLAALNRIRQQEGSSEARGEEEKWDLFA